MKIIYTILYMHTHSTNITFLNNILDHFREAAGCPDLVPPEDAWLKRNDDEATVGCYSSRQTWQLRCNGHQWTGVLGNCTGGKSTFSFFRTAMVC